MPASNALLDMLQTATDRGWCTTPYCTTCGSREFRGSLALLVDLNDALLDLDPAQLMRFSNWVGSLELVGLHARGRVDWSLVLARWISHVDELPRFADVVLFRLIFKGGLGSPGTRDAWLSECARVAMLRKDVSLLESVVLTGGSAYRVRPDIIASVTEMRTLGHGLPRALARIPSRSSNSESPP